MAALNAKAAAGGIAAVLAAASIAAPVVVRHEGWLLHGYADVAHGAKLATACAGVTKDIELGRKYSDPDCRGRTAQALVEHAFSISACLPGELPPNTRAAYTSFAYNVGVGAFCKSSIAQAARAGDIRTSCVRMNTKPNGKPQWVYANGKVYPGLVKRRVCERAMCESGLTGADFRKACDL